MNINKLSKTRLAAIGISVDSLISAIENDVKIQEIFKKAKNGNLQQRTELGEFIWNELSVIGIQSKTKHGIARCFEAALDQPIVPIFDSCPYYMLFIRTPYAPIVPTINNNGHDYHLHTVCVLNSTGSKNKAMKIDGTYGNTLTSSKLAIPSMNSIFEFFSTNGVKSLDAIRGIYSDLVWKRFYDNKDLIFGTTEKYIDIENRIKEINEKMRSPYNDKDTIAIV